jgi:hypothetical protein
MPIAIETIAANEQHYELPPEFFVASLGPNLKYSPAAAFKSSNVIKSSNVTHRSGTAAACSPRRSFALPSSAIWALFCRQFSPFSICSELAL